MEQLISGLKFEVSKLEYPSDWAVFHAALKNINKFRLSIGLEALPISERVNIAKIYNNRSKVKWQPAIKKEYQIDFNPFPELYQSDNALGSIGDMLFQNGTYSEVEMNNNWDVVFKVLKITKDEFYEGDFNDLLFIYIDAYSKIVNRDITNPYDQMIMMLGSAHIAFIRIKNKEVAEKFYVRSMALKEVMLKLKEQANKKGSY